MEVCAITVAYNSPDELARLFESLKTHSSLLEGVVVVDNSNDTYAAANLRTFHKHSQQFGFACYSKTEENSGSAGGFHRGMRVAYEQGFNWVWLLDQDGTVTDRCLTELLTYASEGDVLCPKIVNIHRSKELLSEMRYKRNLFGALYPAPLPVDYCQIQAFGTHAVLISKKVLSKIGYYDDRNFFVGLEDHDYAFRAQQAGFTVLFVAGAEAQHPDLLHKRVEMPLSFAQNPTTTKRNKKRRRASWDLAWIVISNILLIVRAQRLFPPHLGYVMATANAQNRCEKNRSLATFSRFYLQSQSLSNWQYIVAVAYSLFCGLFSKSIKKEEICLQRSFKTYVECFVAKIRKDWPYNRIEEYCSHVWGVNEGTSSASFDVSG